MTKKIPLTIIILVYNEEKNIEKCLKSIREWAQDIFIVDSFSTDNTLSIAGKYTDKIYQHKFESFAKKFNWALENLPITTEFVMRLDADEVVVDPEGFFYKLKKWMGEKHNVVGLYINRRYFFLNHWIRYGGMYPRKVLRVWRTGSAFFEDRLIDEKMIINGSWDSLNIDIADTCQKGFAHWMTKHLQYAKREAIESRMMCEHKSSYEYEFDNITYKNKQRYYRLPIFVRPFAYFIYRLILQKGFKDGFIGIAYHFMHAFVYRELVDYNIMKNRFIS